MHRKDVINIRSKPANLEKKIKELKQFRQKGNLISVEYAIKAARGPLYLKKKGGGTEEYVQDYASHFPSFSHHSFCSSFF